jgi:hypothetical protein
VKAKNNSPSVVCGTQTTEDGVPQTEVEAKNNPHLYPSISSNICLMKTRSDWLEIANNALTLCLKSSNIDKLN